MVQVLNRPKRAIEFGVIVAVAVLTAACGQAEEQAGQPEQTSPESLIYAWMFDAAQEVPNFLAVIDADAASETYGTILKTIPTEGIRGDAHHSNFTLPYSGKLFANDFAGNGSFIFDTSDPHNPVLQNTFGNIGDYSFAHTFAELPNGNMLATFQTTGEANDLPGGLVELTTTGELVQAGSADPGNPDLFIRPYSMVLLPHLDRVVTTVNDMKAGDVGRHMQVWRLSDLKLLHTVPVAAPDGGRAGVAENPFEVRLLADGKTVMFVTLSCGLYTLTDVDSDAPQVTYLHDFEGEFCFLPIREGNYWVQTVVPDFEGGDGALVVMDVSDPASPVVADRIDMAPGMVPHWLAPENSGKRIVLTGFGAELGNRVMLLNFDPQTGKIEIDQTFGAGNEAGPGVMIDMINRPQGEPGPAEAHGAVFWPPADPTWKN